MCDKAVDDCLAALKFIPDWFVTSKMLEKFHDALLINDDTYSLFWWRFYKVTFFADEIGILGVNVDKINLADVNDFYEDDPEIIIHVKHLDWHNKFQKCKATKKFKSMPTIMDPKTCKI